MSKKVKRNRESDAIKNSFIRLLVSVFIIILVLTSIKLKFESHYVSAIRGVLACILFMWSLISILRSSAVIRSSPPNKPKSKVRAKKQEMIPTSIKGRQTKFADNAVAVKKQSIATLLSDNDIIEFEVLMGGAIIKFGASSDLEPGGSVFFNKQYYLGDTEYADLDDLMEALDMRFTDEIPVLSIDGVKPAYYQIP